MMLKDPKPNKSIYELMKNINEGMYVIPHFQRAYKWTPNMVVELLVSIIQDYFTGLLLFWELPNLGFHQDTHAGNALTDDNNQKRDKHTKQDNDTVQEIVEEPWDALWGAPKAAQPSFAILDGQQRLASLYYAIHGPRKVFPKRKSYFSFWLNVKKFLDGEYEESVFSTFSTKYTSLAKIKSKKEEWISNGIIPLRILSDRKFVDSDAFNDWLRKYAQKFMSDPNNIDEYDRLRDRIRSCLYEILNYEWVTYTLGNERDLADVCGIFARINQKGMKLSTFDLMNAFLYPHGISLRKLWENIDNQVLYETTPEMDEYLLKLISLHKQDYCSSKYIYYLIPEQKVKKKDEKSGKLVEVILVKDATEFLNLWENACNYSLRAVSKIMNVGKDDFGAIKHDFIPNTTIIPVMAALLLKYDLVFKYQVQDSKFNRMLSSWFWSAVISGDYSGSSDTIMAEDYRDLCNWFVDQDSSKVRRVAKFDKEFISRLNLIDCEKKSSLYNAILCLIALNKAEDFYTVRVLDTGTYRGESIHDHHIFPKKVRGLTIESSTKFEDTKDSILNRTLLLDETNESIMTKKPSQYINEVLRRLNGDRTKLKKLLNKHLISDECIEYLEKDNYDSFIIAREKVIKRKLLDVLNLY